MPNLRVLAIRWADTDQFPFVLETEVTDADGVRRSIVDKEPIFGGPELSLDTVLPTEILLECEVLTRTPDRVRITIDLPHGVLTSDGTADFDVHPDQLTD
ncbi:hypothetical protein OG474_08075 [Kribbella sp. NBC_01505]|uniref:hypothetical protein n=1 Tax=Kribbella sp. NBC_01505 TaxID=2903580 RepID=UPI00386F6EFD